MSLTRYNEKRNFKATSEPEGKIGQSKNGLIFTIQKHAASHPHYDFRLEIDGVLKSWAVPKGPSLDPEVKRLAMMVEDHPYSYKDFEGRIPEGNYGAGHVIVWDNGTYTPAGPFEGSGEKVLRAGLKKGHLSFLLNGHKLKGEFALIKLRGKQENAWLLVKKEDRYASKTDILAKDKSVLSRTTLEKLQQKSEPSKSKTSKKSTSAKKSKPADVPMPGFIKPMLADTVEEPFDNSDWIFENKFDGYRTLATIHPDGIELYSRNGLSFNHHFKPIAEALKKIKHTAVLDGEVVAEDADGRSNFQLLQNYLKTAKGKLKYYLFDILSLDGNDTTGLELLQRKELLRLLLDKNPSPQLVYCEHTQTAGIEAYQKAVKMNAEGIMAKKANSTYLAGQRNSDWLKIKISQQEEALILGITEPRNSRKYFGALLLGQYDGANLRYIGKCGTGFNEASLKELYGKFRRYFVETPPLEGKLPIRDTIQWMKPQLVAQVKFIEWTQDNHLRHPVFLGLRMDKKPKEVQFTTKKPTVMTKKQTPEKRPDEQDLKIGKATLHLTNQNKVYFPEDGITKGDLIAYYDQVADLILPYLKNRPQSMNRYPSGIHGPSFYQKDVDTEKIPAWLKTASLYSESNQAEIDYLICNDKATLLYMANLGCIEINPWNATLKKPDNPDWMVIDIDPAKEEFNEVVKTALTVKTVMDELQAPCYCKTSGATGLHVYLPLEAKYDYDTVKIFAQLIAAEVQARLPETTTLERTIKKRNHKIYIDFLQNRKGQTLAAPYSARPKPGATVSTPLEWDEVNETLSPSQFTIHTVLERFRDKGDLWKPVLGKGANIAAILKKMEANKQV